MPELSQEQKATLSKFSLVTAAKMYAINVIFMVVVVFASFSILDTKPAQSDMVDSGFVILLVIIVLLQIASFYVLPRFLLLRLIRKSKPKTKIQITNESLNFTPYVWRWFFIVLAIHIPLAILSIGLDIELPRAIPVAVTMFAYFAANYDAVQRLIKTQNAQIG